MDTNLPFPEGKSMTDLGNGICVDGPTLDANSYLGIAGQTYEVPDRDHISDAGTTVAKASGKRRKLIAIKNGASAFTIARKFYAWGTGAGDWGRRAEASNTVLGAGKSGFSIPDSYPVGTVIPAYDIFYGQLEGPNLVLSETGTFNLTAHDPIASDSGGYVNGAAAAATETVLGTIDQSGTDEDTEVLVHLAIDLRPEVSS
jgi:hypothetical protein